MESAQIDSLIKTTLKVGTYCIHRAWGVGLIKSFDEKTGKLTIHFENDKSSHQMDPAFVMSKLEILPDAHIIVRHRRNPAEIQSLIDSNPAEIFSIILSVIPSHTLSASETELVLERLMGPSYKKWLSSAKKKLAKDSQVVFPEKKTDPYKLREAPVAADDEILVAFYKTKNVKKKMELSAELLSHAPLPQEVTSKLPTLVEELSTAISESKVLTAGERLQGAWIRDDLSKTAGVDSGKFQPTPESLVKDASDLQELSEQLPAEYLRRMLDLIFATYPAEWQKIAFDLLKNSSGKATAECVGFLMDRDCAQQLSETLSRWLLEQSLKAPILQWIIKNRTQRRFSTMLSRLISPQLMSAVFYAIDHEAIQNASSKRIALVELLSEDKELIPELLATATPEVARDLAHTMMMSQGFETLTKRSLIARFIKQFPEIQSLISSEDQSSTSDNLVVSWESLEKRKAEYQLLVTKKIPENKEAIAVAREMGDLSENSEYKMARQDNDTLMALKAQMERELRLARGTDFGDASTTQAGIGSVVELQGSSGKTTYTILGAWDGNPEKRILSYLTPMAQALIGKKIDEKVSVGGSDYTIAGLKRWVDGK
jgi:transcription elongation GreA/GreB family factor